MKNFQKVKQDGGKSLARDRSPVPTRVPRREETLRYFHRNNESERSSLPQNDQKPKEKKRKERENEKSLCTSGTVDEHLNRPSRPEIGSHDVLQTFRGVDVHEQSRGFIHAFGVWVHRTERGGHFDGKFWSVVGVGVVLLKVVECF